MQPLGVAPSKSHIELEQTKPATITTSGTKRPNRRVKWHRSLSVDPVLTPPTTTTGGPHPAGGGDEGSMTRSSSTPSVAERLMSNRAMQFLSSKSGMSTLWRFLKGKAGEKNLLFWLDAERIKYYSSQEERHRYKMDVL